MQKKVVWNLWEVLRCECNHDGKEVEYKLSRKRGQHGFDAAAVSSSKRVRDKHRIVDVNPNFVQA